MVKGSDDMVSNEKGICGWQRGCCPASGTTRGHVGKVGTRFSRKDAREAAPDSSKHASSSGRSMLAADSDGVVPSVVHWSPPTGASFAMQAMAGTRDRMNK